MKKIKLYFALNYLLNREIRKPQQLTWVSVRFGVLPNSCSPHFLKQQVQIFLFVIKKYLFVGIVLVFVPFMLLLCSQRTFRWIRSDSRKSRHFVNSLKENDYLQNWTEIWESRNFLNFKRQIIYNTDNKYGGYNYKICIWQNCHKNYFLWKFSTSIEYYQNKLLTTYLICLSLRKIMYSIIQSVR